MHEEYYIKGYQWGAYGQFTGEYTFPANKDRYDIHMPPNTTLIEPPRNLPVDQEAAWNGVGWIVRNVQFDWLPDVSSYSENFFGILDPEPTVEPVADIVVTEGTSNGD